MRKPFKWLIILGILVAMGGLVPSIHASEVTFTVKGSGSDGSLAAEATFTISNGEIEVTITNTLNPATIISIGQAVSDLSFKVSNSPGKDTGNTATGQQVNVSKKGGSVTDVPGTPGRWVSSSKGGFSISGDTINLEAIGHGQPTELILPSDGGGGYPDSNSSIDVHSPNTDGPATFTLDLSGVTSSTTISDVQFSFGTGPDKYLPGTVTPEPASMLLFGTGLLSIGFLMRKRLA